MIRQNRNGGFTLVELIVAVAIVGILAAVAFPSYENSIRKGRRNDGQAEMLNAAQRLETYYATNGTYTADMTQIGYTAAAGNASEKGHYEVSVLGPTVACPITRCYMLSGVPTPGSDQADDLIAEFQLSSTGQRQRDEGGGLIDGWQ